MKENRNKEQSLAFGVELKAFFFLIITLQHMHAGITHAEGRSWTSSFPLIHVG